MPVHHRLVTVRRRWEVSIVVEEVYMESYEVGGGAANGLPTAGLVPGVVPSSGPVLDHSAQKDRRLLAQQGSLGKRRKPSRGSLHVFLSALHRWTPGDSSEDSSEATTAVTADAAGSAPLPAARSAPSGRPSARSSPPPLATDIDNVNEADAKPKPYRTNQEQAEINNNKNITNKNDVKSETSSNNKPGVRFIADSERPASAGGLLESSKKSEGVRPGVGGTILGHRRQSSLDSGCSLDMSSSSSSSGKGSPDPVAPTLTPPPEFADTPIMERRRRSRRRHTSGASTTGAAPGTTSGSPGVGTYSAVPKVPDSIPRIPRAKETTASTVQQPSSPEIHINFRILPRAKARGGANGVGPQVSRSESCRPFSKCADSAPPPAFKTMSWDRHLLSSPSDRYLDDSERRCRSLSRPSRLPFTSNEEGSKRDPEWLEIARRRQATGVDWENLETHMKQPQSISCSNLSESHMRGKVSTLASADRAGLRLVRSASALYPRIKMSRFERRMRRENPNPSPERRRSSDEFVLVSSSSSSSDAASAGASSTEDEKPSFLNVQLRHVEKAPPLNVVFQTRGGGVGVAGAVEPAPAVPRSASPTLTWKSHREDNVAVTTPSPTRLDRPPGASARSDRVAAGRTRTASESLGVAEYLTPKRVELIEAPVPATKKDAGGHARGSPTRTALSDHVSRGGVRGGPPLRRSSSVQMRSRDVMSTGRASPWDTTDSAVTPSWILEAERKKKSGIDWARLDKSLSQTGGKRATNLSSECLHQPTSATEVVPDWLKEIRKKKQEDASIRLSRSSEDILNEANVIDSATPRPQPRSPTEALRKTPPTAAQRSTEQPTSTEVSGVGSSIPPPPPMPPSDFWSKPKEVWFKQQMQKPGAGVLVAPVCQRDSETQTHIADYGAQVTSPVQAFSPTSMLHAMTPFATYTRPFVTPTGNQVLLLDDRSVQLQSGPLYAMPIYAGATPTSTSDRPLPLPPQSATGVFPATPAVLVARDDDRFAKKVPMESKSTSTDGYFAPTSSPAPAASGTTGGGDTKSLLDEVEKKLEQDRKPPDESRPRTVTPAAGGGGVSKITTVETMTIMETLESTTVSRRAIDETSLKSICGRSGKEDVLSGLSDSPIPFADDDDVMEELGFSSRVESRSASRAEEKSEVLSDEKVTMYSSTRKHSVPRTEPKETVQLRDVKSPPLSKQVNGEHATPKPASPPRVPSPQQAVTPLRATTPPLSSAKGTLMNGHRSPPRSPPYSPPLETSFDVVDRGFHTEPLKKKVPNGVTVLSSSKGESVTSKFQRPSCISPSSSTVTTGPDGTLRGAHARTAAQTLAAATKEYCNGDVRRPLGPFKATKSMSDSNLGARMRPTKRPTASQATQTPNGVLPTFERRGESGFGGRAMGVQTDDRIESFLRDTLRSSTKEVEFVTKVDSSQPSKTLRKKVTTKILRGTSGKAGGVREIIEEIYDQSSVVVRPSPAVKNVTRSVQQTSDGQKYLTTVITEAPPTGRSRRNRRRGFGDPDTHIIMV
ncbi:serine/arginine repetitive matrix protein 2 isoform X4 [Rhipicephalus sanguineus]|uniref:serine/arginine repetitive matrix protein 2 isoform X4 n=1 Tax=Rhipicephalus sanguineus TaxID=34632 RepID=UPI0020C279D2|nr:serine/arginine repetitive matrix protein 2 isoform X4 [Rhipicephalus sanguineus]